jgi:hypothetical protein
MANRFQTWKGRFLLTVFVTAELLGVFCSTAVAQQFGPWSTPVNLGASINSVCSDQHPALSKDGLSLYFASDRVLDQNGNVVACAGFPNYLQLWVTHRDCIDSTDPSCAWHVPEFLNINSAPNPFVATLYNDNAPNLSTDGHWLFFHSRRPGGCNAGVTVNGSLVYYLELWAAHRRNNRDDQGWETPINLGCTLNIPQANEAGPTFWEDDSTGTLYLYFNRDLLPQNPNNPDSDAPGTYTDIYISTCTADIATCNTRQLWNQAVYVPELSSPVRDTRTAIRRRDGLEMILTSNRSGDADSGLSAGGFDSWVSTRASAQDVWSIPINLNQDNLNKCSQLGIDPCPAVNTSANDGAPALSWDGQTLLFYSNRAGGSGGNDLFMSARTKLPD